MRMERPFRACVEAPSPPKQTGATGPSSVVLLAHPCPSHDPHPLSKVKLCLRMKPLRALPPRKPLPTPPHRVSGLLMAAQGHLYGSSLTALWVGTRYPVFAL